MVEFKNECLGIMSVVHFFLTRFVWLCSSLASIKY